MVATAISWVSFLSVRQKVQIPDLQIRRYRLKTRQGSLRRLTTLSNHCGWPMLTKYRFPHNLQFSPAIIALMLYSFFLTFPTTYPTFYRGRLPQKVKQKKPSDFDPVKGHWCYLRNIRQVSYTPWTTRVLKEGYCRHCVFVKVKRIECSLCGKQAFLGVLRDQPTVAFLKNTRWNFNKNAPIL